MATYDQWLELYSAAYDAVPGPFSAPCPHCGHRRLRLVFTGDPERLVGYGRRTSSVQRSSESRLKIQS